MLALAGLCLVMGACGPPPPTAPGPEPATSDAPVSTGRSGSDAPEKPVEAQPLPLGHCGQAPGSFKAKVYQGTPETDCHAARAALIGLAKGQGDDSGHVDGHGTDVDGWSCVYPMDAEVKDYALTLVCEKDRQKFFVRPASMPVPAGYHVEPWDYHAEGAGAGSELYFTTESRKHHCSFIEDRVGCDNHNFPDDLPTVSYMGAQQQPTAIELDRTGRPRFTAYGDPVYSLASPSGEWGADTEVLGYGQLLLVRGVACTTDEDRGVVCTNGRHGFEISSRDYALR